MTLTIDAYRYKLMDKILLSESQDEVKRFIIPRIIMPNNGAISKWRGYNLNS